jgi:hypothetical protein
LAVAAYSLITGGQQSGAPKATAQSGQTQAKRGLLERLRAHPTYEKANEAGVKEVETARQNVGYKPAQHGWKLLHAGRAYHWTLKAAEFLFGTSSGVLGYLGRVVVTPFVTVGGILYELHAAFNPFLNPQFPLDKQNPLNLLFDTLGDLIANTYGQLVALTPGLSAETASIALRAVAYIPGPDSTIGFWRLSWPKFGY